VTVYYVLRATCDETADYVRRDRVLRATWPRTTCDVRNTRMIREFRVARRRRWSVFVRVLGSARSKAQKKPRRRNLWVTRL